MFHESLILFYYLLAICYGVDEIDAFFFISLEGSKPFKYRPRGNIILWFNVTYYVVYWMTGLYMPADDGNRMKRWNLVCEQLKMYFICRWRSIPQIVPKLYVIAFLIAEVCNVVGTFPDFENYLHAVEAYTVTTVSFFESSSTSLRPT